MREIRVRGLESRDDVQQIIDRTIKNVDLLRVRDCFVNEEFYGITVGSETRGSMVLLTFRREGMFVYEVSLDNLGIGYFGELEIFSNGARIIPLDETNEVYDTNMQRLRKMGVIK